MKIVITIFIVLLINSCKFETVTSGNEVCDELLKERNHIITIQYYNTIPDAKTINKIDSMMIIFCNNKTTIKQ